MIRSRRMVPTPEVVSVLLLAFDKLRELIQDYATSNQVDISEFVEALMRLTADHLPAAEKRTVTERVSIPMVDAGSPMPVSAFDLRQVQEGGRSLYLIECDLIHDVQKRGKTPYELIRKLIDAGTILESAFDLESAGTLDDEPSNQLLLESAVCDERGSGTGRAVVGNGAGSYSPGRLQQRPGIVGEFGSRSDRAGARGPFRTSPHFRTCTRTLT